MKLNTQKLNYMMLEEENLDGKITGLGFANACDWTTGELFDEMIFFDVPMSNLLKSRSHGGFATGEFVAGTFALELWILIFWDL